MGNDISSSTFFQRSLGLVNIRLPDRIMRHRSATHGNDKGADSKSASRSTGNGRASSLSASPYTDAACVQHQQSPRYSSSVPSPVCSTDNDNNNLSFDDQHDKQLLNNELLSEGGRRPSENKSTARDIIKRSKNFVKRSKSWRGGSGGSPDSRDRIKNSKWNADCSSKSSPGADSVTLKRVRSPDLQINDTSIVDEYDDFFERAAAASAGLLRDKERRRVSAGSPSYHYKDTVTSPGRGNQLFYRVDKNRGDSTEEFDSACSPPDSPVHRPRTLTLGVGVPEGRLFLRVPSPASDDLTTSSLSNRSIGIDSLTEEDNNLETVSNIRQKSTSFSRQKSSSFRRPSQGGTVRFAEDTMTAPIDTGLIVSDIGASRENPRISLSPPSSTKLSTSSPTSLDVKPDIRSVSSSPINTSASPMGQRNLKQSISATELQKKRRADDRRKTIATTGRPTEPETTPMTINGKKSPSSSARSASCATVLSLLTPAQITLIRQHWNQTYVTKGPSVLGTHVFQRACFKVPAIKEVFNHIDFTDKLPNVDLVSKQHAKMVALLIDEVVKNLDHLETIVPKLYDIGRKHSQYYNKGFHANYWAVFAESFIDCTLEWGEKIRRVEEARKAWAILIAFAVDRMKIGFQDGKRDLTRQKLSGGDSQASDGAGCGSPPKA